MENRNAWIIGSRGFIGRNMSSHLARNGFRVVGAGIGDWTREAAAEWGVSHWIDGETTEATLAALRAAGDRPDVVYHFGSVPSGAGRTPLSDLQSTVAPAARLLEHLRVESPESAVVLVSNAAVYGDGHAGPIPETASLEPSAAYGTYRAIVEMIGRSYAREHGMKVRIARIFSCYGPGLERQLLWELCRKLAAKVNPIVLPGTGRETRDWIHVSDTVRALELLISPSLPNDHVVNIGTGWGTSVREIANMVHACWGGKVEIGFDGCARPGDAAALVADTGRLNELGFVAETPVEQGVADAVAWYRDRLKSGMKARISGTDGNA